MIVSGESYSTLLMDETIYLELFAVASVQFSWCLELVLGMAINLFIILLSNVSLCWRLCVLNIGNTRLVK